MAPTHCGNGHRLDDGERQTDPIADSRSATLGAWATAAVLLYVEVPRELVGEDGHGVLGPVELALVELRCAAGPAVGREVSGDWQLSSRRLSMADAMPTRSAAAALSTSSASVVSSSTLKYPGAMVAAFDASAITTPR